MRLTRPHLVAGTRGGAQAVAAARAFLARELGMTDLVAGPFRSAGTGTGEVGFRHRYGEGRRLLPQTGPYAVVVRLQRLPAGWWVLGVQGRSIQITSPVRLQRIGSPLTVRGKAEVYEGSLYFKVTQDRFTAPTPAPHVLSVATSPTLRDVEGWLELPKGPGTVRFSVRASNTDRVRLVLTPTGTGTGPYGELLGEDHDARDGFTLTWNYGAGDAGSAHLTVQATGPGGTVDHVINIAHAA